jgi:transcription termination/antitermination protein NusG
MSGQEELVATILRNKSGELPIYSIILMPNIRNYIIIEVDNENTLKRAIVDIPYVQKRMLPIGNVNKKELESMLQIESIMDNLEKGMTVEIKSGHLKGEKARILRVNPQKEEVTVEILDATIKMPITIKAENIRVIKE